MASKYGETHDIFNTHHTETKAKLDSLLAKNTQIEVNNDGVEAKLDSIIAKNGEIDTVLDASKVVLDNILTKNGEIDAVLDNVLVKNGEIDTVLDASKVVLDNILTKNGEIDTAVDSLSAKITACNTGACVVSSSALPSGASVSAKQDEIKTLIGATNSALASTLTVSAPAVTKSASTPVSSQAIQGQSSFTSAELDINTAKHFTIFGSSSDTTSSHEVDVLVSNSSGGTYYETSHSGFYLAGNFHLLVSHMPYRYIKVKVKNGDSNVGNSADFTIHLVQSN